MKQPQGRVYLLKDLASLTGYSIYTLKFYLQLGLIHEVDRSPETRFRYFDDVTVARLQQIRRLRLQKRTLAEIRSLLARQEPGSGP